RITYHRVPAKAGLCRSAPEALRSGSRLSPGRLVWGGVAQTGWRGVGRGNPFRQQLAMAVIPENFHDLLEQKKAFAHLATIMKDGSPQVTPVWFDYTGGMIRVNTAKGRVKARNLREGAPV